MAFDLDQFMNQTVDAPMETTYPAHPEGEFLFMLDNEPKMLTPKHITGSNEQGSWDFHQMELLCV